MPIESQLYKDVFSRWSTGVSVVTTIYGGQWKGTTVSSFTSVSLNPPLVLICLAQSLYTHQLVMESQVFAVNVLRQEQIETGRVFAGMMPEITDRFAHGNWLTAHTGSPVLGDCLAWVDCTVVQTYPAGDHTIFVGEVQAAYATAEGMPLVYHNRQWGEFTAMDGTS